LDSVRFFVGSFKMSAHLTWLIIRNNNAYLLKKRNIKKPFSTESNNLTNLSSFRYSGLIHKKSVGVVSAPDNKGFTVVYKKSRASVSLHVRFRVWVWRELCSVNAGSWQRNFQVVNSGKSWITRIHYFALTISLQCLKCDVMGTWWLVNMCVMSVLKYSLLVECRFTVCIYWYGISCWLMDQTWRWEAQSSATVLFPWGEQVVVWCNGSDAVADDCAFVLEGIVVIKHEWRNLELKFSSNMISSVRL